MSAHLLPQLVEVSGMGDTGGEGGRRSDRVQVSRGSQKSCYVVRTSLG
jgi:hypothetical protein